MEALERITLNHPRTLRIRSALLKAKLSDNAPVGSAPLKGRFRDETGDLLTPTHTQRHGRRLRYYVSNRLIARGGDPKAWRLPAPGFEAATAKAVAEHLANHARRHAVLKRPDAVVSSELSRRASALAKKINASGIRAAAPLIVAGEIAPARLRISLDGVALAKALEISADDLDPDLLAIDAPFTHRRRGVETKIVAGEREAKPDAALIRALQNAHLWSGEMRKGAPLNKIAKKHGVSRSYAGRVIPLACLSPRIQQAIIDGAQPLALTLETVIRSTIPLDWSEQEKLFGFIA